MDVSSGAAVQALLFHNVDDKLQKGDLATNDNNFRVLDLCCAPGLKTCAIADILDQSQFEEATNIEIVGVDVNPSRLHLGRNIIEKYHIDADTSGRSMNDLCNLSISLFCADGTTFGTRTSLQKDVDSLKFESTLARNEKMMAGKRKRMNKSAKSRERKRLKTLGKDMFHGTQLLNTDESSECCSRSSLHDNDDEIMITRFDRVLVDAECSTDGAVRHLQEKIGKTTDCQITNTKLTNSKQLDDLVHLQKRLILSGFRLLKPGGTMVYSTCSLAREQNENVVQWLLDKFENRCVLVPVIFDSVRSSVQEKKISMISPGFDNVGVRFHPSIDNGNMIYGGGFYLAKLKKLAL
jgi:16S rRNA C967 or C1407 C5-methylase (RsmB/RsmF family)